MHEEARDLTKHHLEQVKNCQDQGLMQICSRIERGSIFIRSGEIVGEGSFQRRPGLLNKIIPSKNTPQAQANTELKQNSVSTILLMAALINSCQEL